MHGLLGKSSNIIILGTTDCYTINYIKSINITQTINDNGITLFDEIKIISDNKITIKNGMALTYVTANFVSIYLY